MRPGRGGAARPANPSDRPVDATRAGRKGWRMVEVALPPAVPRRQLFADERGSGLRVSWHEQRGLVVVSMWRGDVCTGTVRLTVADATRLATFLLGHLGERAASETTELPVAGGA